MRDLVVSIGGSHNAKVKRTWRGSFATFVDSLISKVPETDDKASTGWVCGAEFDPPYRDSENFVARHLLSFDYDHIDVGDIERIIACYGANSHLAYTTWSHTFERPRLRLWLPVSRALGYDEFQAVSRRVAARFGIEKAARESHVPAQYMFRPGRKKGGAFDSFVNTEAPWLDADQILGEYDDWTDRSQWPHRAEGDGVHSEGTSIDPRSKPGMVGAFCRAFSISEAIERFDLPYVRAGNEGRWTYTLGSRPEGAIVYDDDTKLHSHHDTDPARGQSNAYDLVRLHHFGWLDEGVGHLPVGSRPSSAGILALALREPTVQRQIVLDEGFVDLDNDPEDFSWLDVDDVRSTIPMGGPFGESPKSPALPERITKPTSRLSDQENARRIQRRFEGQLISIGGTFYFWSGKYWRADIDGAYSARCATRLSAMVGSEAIKLQEEADKKEKPSDQDLAEIAGLWKWAGECGNSSKQNACLAMLRSLLAMPAESLNTSTELFSCANGTLNLRTGELKAHDPKDFITACSPFEYDPAAEAPRFRQFLSEIFNGDAEVMAFAKRWFGYCITGSIEEHKMVFHVGGGGNGKSTLMDLLRHVLGPDYYATSPASILTLESKGATPELARLLGRRMVTISETEETLELREGLIKQLTGGDTIAARMLYKDYFEFQPTHKLQVFTNFTPLIRGQDFAIWRRILLLTYPASYGDAAQVAQGEAQRVGDPKLEIALQAEAPGVLRWLVEGARDWYEQRLAVPEPIKEATKKNRLEQDLVGQFVRERAIQTPGARTALTGGSGAVFPAYTGWCGTMNIRPFSRNRFVKELLRVAPWAKPAAWSEGTIPMAGFTGLTLTDSDPVL